MIPALDVLVSSPFPIDSLQGNSVSARRIARRLRAAGLEAEARHGYEDENAAALIALHSRRGLPAITAYRKRYPARPIITVLTGSDLYKDLPAGRRDVLEGMELADALVTYQEASLADVPAPFRDKAITIWKSVELPMPDSDALHPPPQSPVTFTLLAHLREIKDPFLAARALAHVPATPAVRIQHFGSTLDESLRETGRDWMRRDPRYLLDDARPREAVAATIAASHATINSGRAEGGSNAVCESIVLSTPVLATRTPANIRFLGEDYGGFFPVGDERALATLIGACAQPDGQLLRSLAGQVEARAPLFTPESESAGWRGLLEKLL